ncbi:MAG: sulfatase-like hydrolase/transferase, partial [Pirellulaceae bacterium]|nr:sulfatase-like hydrolase/transferase [Pirellulaceae bacterium]
WDLGTLNRYLPTSKGFDDFYGFVNTGIDYYTHERYGVPSMVRNLQSTTEDAGTYCTYLFEREALRFLQEQPQNQPFFLYVPFNAPHGSSSLDPAIRTTVQAPKKFQDMYPPVDVESRTVEKYRYASPATVRTAAARVRDYRAAVTCMDAAIGKLITVLQERQQLENTIIIFLSDNGGGGGSDNSPLKGRKSQTWEGGIRVPCIVHWPAGGVPANSVNHEFLTSLEVLPSLTSACKTKVPSKIKLDGFDWWDVIRGSTPSPRHEMFWKRKDLIGVRVGNWKWVDMGGESGGLFDLSKDIGETNNLSQSHPEILQMLKQRYQHWLAEMEQAEPRSPFRDY